MHKLCKVAGCRQIVISRCYINDMLLSQAPTAGLLQRQPPTVLRKQMLHAEMLQYCWRAAIMQALAARLLQGQPRHSSPLPAPKPYRCRLSHLGLPSMGGHNSQLPGLELQSSQAQGQGQAQRARVSE